MQLTNSLVTICCNSVLAHLGGDVYISVMTIISSIRQIVETPIYAITEGSSPILSYNYGAKRSEKVKKCGIEMAFLVLLYTGIAWSVILFAPSSDGVFLAEPVSNIIGGSLCFIVMLYLILPELKRMQLENEHIRN